MRAVIQLLKPDSLPSEAKEACTIQDLAESNEIDTTGLLMYTGRATRVPWLPLHLRTLLLQMEHDHPLCTHAGYLRTLRRVQERFQWLGMQSNISRYVRSCNSRQAFEPRRQMPKALVDSSWATNPVQYLSVDLIGPLLTTARQNKHIPIVLDKFTNVPSHCGEDGGCLLPPRHSSENFQQQWQAIRQ